MQRAQFDSHAGIQSECSKQRLAEGNGRRIRKAFALQLKPGCAVEYERRHNPIWPELERVFRRHGVRGYSIFLCDITSQLFGYVEIEDESRWTEITSSPEMQRWRSYMKDVLVYNDSGAPAVAPLREVFRLE